MIKKKKKKKRKKEKLIFVVFWIPLHMGWTFRRLSFCFLKKNLGMVF